MTITPEQILRLRVIAEADMNGAGGKAWDEAVTPEVVIALCEKVKQLDKEAEWLAKRLHEADERVAVRWWRKAARKAVEGK